MAVSPTSRFLQFRYVRPAFPQPGQKMRQSQSIAESPHHGAPFYEDCVWVTDRDKGCRRTRARMPTARHQPVPVSGSSANGRRMIAARSSSLFRSASSASDVVGAIRLLQRFVREIVSETGLQSDRLMTLVVRLCGGQSARMCQSLR